jgi:CDP-6-deoxy-D-xylo-4-hexulose-3-dehydrase
LNVILDGLGDNFNTLNYVYNNQDKFIPGISPVYYSGPYWGKEEIIAAINSLITGKWLSSGENVHKFEIQLAKKINEKHSVMVNSGSSANLVMLAALKKYFGWQDGDEIIVSVVGFPTTIAPIVQNNLKPVFIDIEMDTLNFDVSKISEKITEKTRAIFISPVLGNPPNIDLIYSLCSRYNLHPILDNCDSLGTKWNDRYLNEYAVASSYSFYPAHHISTGEGGMVMSNNKEIIDIARSFAWWGRDCYCVGAANMLPNGTCGCRFSRWIPEYDGVLDHKYIFTNMGYNLKPLDLQGAIGLVQLTKFDEIHERRKQSRDMIVDIFMKYLDAIKVQAVFTEADVSWFGTGFICPDKEYKNKLVKFLEDNKIQTRNYFAGNILIHPGYKDLGDWKDYPIANKVLDQVFFIGSSPSYNHKVFEYIEDVMRKFDE